MIKIDDMPRRITVGRTLDNGYSALQIDCGEWVKRHPQFSEYRIEVKRPDGEMYFADTTFADGVLTWNINAADTAIAGDGEFQIVAVGTDGERKTSSHPIMFVSDIIAGTASETPPEANKAWTDKVIEETRKSATQAAASAAEARETLESIPEDYKELAQEVGKLSEEIDEVYSTTAEILDFVPSKNLIDISKIIKGYEMANNRGELAAKADWYVTDWIEVEPNTTYTISGTSSLYRAEVNENKDTYTGILGSIATFTTGAETKYVRFNSLIDGYGTPQLEKGSTATEYEAYGLCSRRLDTIETLQSNLYDGGLIFGGRNIYLNGRFVSTTTRISTEIFKAGENDLIDVTICGEEKVYIYYFDRIEESEYVLISEQGWNEQSQTIKVPYDCYIMLSLAKSDNAVIEPNMNDSKIVHVKNGGFDYPYYWGRELREKTAIVNEKMNEIGGCGDAFVFMTDTHWGQNEKNSPKIVKKILDNTTVKNVFCGGDIYSRSDGGFADYAKSWKGVDVYTARGNHDQNPLATDSTDIISDAEYYNQIIRPIQEGIVSNGKTYFYKDNQNQKIRYIFMDSGCYYTHTLDDVQLTWLKDRITELSAEWHVLVIQHWVLDGKTIASGETPIIAERGQLTIDAINSVWAEKNCNVIGIICGHIHRDMVVTEPVNGYPIIATSCDASGATRNDYDPVNSATTGTTTEQLMDVFVIDLLQKTINITRYGAGANRIVTW